MSSSTYWTDGEWRKIEAVAEIEISKIHVKVSSEKWRPTAMTSHREHPVKCRYSAAAEMSLWSGMALCPGWASSWWCWIGVSSSLDCTEKVDGGSEAVGDHPSLSWSGRAEADAVSLHLSESRPGPYACSRGAAWCRAQRERRMRRTPRGAGSSRRYFVAPLVMMQLCPRCPHPSPDPECPLWNRQSRSVMSNAETF